MWKKKTEMEKRKGETWKDDRKDGRKREMRESKKRTK